MIIDAPDAHLVHPEDDLPEEVLDALVAPNRFKLIDRTFKTKGGDFRKKPAPRLNIIVKSRRCQLEGFV